MMKRPVLCLLAGLVFAGLWAVPAHAQVGISVGFGGPRVGAVISAGTPIYSRGAYGPAFGYGYRTGVVAYQPVYRVPARAVIYPANAYYYNAAPAVVYQTPVQPVVQVVPRYYVSPQLIVPAPAITTYSRCQ